MSEETTRKISITKSVHRAVADRLVEALAVKGIKGNVRVHVQTDYIVEVANANYPDALQIFRRLKTELRELTWAQRMKR